MICREDVLATSCKPAVLAQPVDNTFSKFRIFLNFVKHRKKCSTCEPLVLEHSSAGSPTGF